MTLPSVTSSYPRYAFNVPPPNFIVKKALFLQDVESIWKWVWGEVLRWELNKAQWEVRLGHRVLGVVVGGYIWS